MSTKTKILLVEDDPLLGDLIMSDLGLIFPFGQVEVLGPVETFSEAVEQLRIGQPDIVLLDIELGDDRTAGIRLAQYINQTLPVPVVFMSGLPRKDGFDVAKLTAPYGYIQKPYQRQQLADQLELLLIQLGQRRQAAVGGGLGRVGSVSAERSSLFVSTAYSELTPIPLEKLVVLQADGKVIRAYLSDQEKPIVFTSPGLKNFFREHQAVLGGDFFQLGRSHVISLSKILQVKDNHVKLPRCVSGASEPFVWLTIPVNGDSRHQLLERLGRRG